MFRPVETGARAGRPARRPDERARRADARTTGALGSRNTTGFGAQRRLSAEGHARRRASATLTFNHRATVERHSFITFNIGDLLHAATASDPAFFRDVSLEDPTFRQREIQSALDGALLPEFERYINSVTVTLRKQHQNGEETLREIVLDRRRRAKPARPAADGLRLERRRRPRARGCNTTTARAGASRAAARTRPTGRARTRR